MLQEVISSNEQLVKSMQAQIKILRFELLKTQQQLKNEKLKSSKLLQQLIIIKNCSQSASVYITMKSRIHLLENQLIQTKLSLAVQNSDCLQKDAQIRDLNSKNKSLEQEIQKFSVLSETDINSEDRRQTQENTFEKLKIDKNNLQQYIKPDFHHNESITSFRQLIDKQILNRSILSQTDTILKAWQKEVSYHILPKTKKFFLSSHVTKEAHLSKFLKETIPLLKKYYGIPHLCRNKVWTFITEDRLSLSNSLYIEMIERRSRGWVSEKIKLQIQKDILRSFNGECSKDKLLKIHEFGLSKLKSENQQKNDFSRRNSMSVSDLSEQRFANSRQFTDSRIRQSPQGFQSRLQTRTQSYFRIAEDVTQVLELFYIYRPDIGFVQGMTYPTIVLTLVAGKLNAFRILCNLLLCNQFFQKMITFQANFISYFCRIFDELLLSYNLALYNRLIRQFDIKSQVFLVDWFFTFFSRGISPASILRFWDLLLYQASTNLKGAEVVLYRLALVIFQLLQPILLQANYEQSIRVIREYFRKIDEEQLISKLYDGIKESNALSSFQEKYQKVKIRVEKKYCSKTEDEEI